MNVAYISDPHQVGNKLPTDLCWEATIDMMAELDVAGWNPAWRHAQKGAV